MKVPPGVEGTVINARVFSRKGVSKDERSKAIEDDEVAKLKQDQQDELRHRAGAHDEPPNVEPALGCTKDRRHPRMVRDTFRGDKRNRPPRTVAASLLIRGVARLRVRGVCPRDPALRLARALAHRERPEAPHQSAQTE